MDPETQLTHPAMTFTCVVQEDVLRGCLGRFYSRAKGEEEGSELYSRTKEQARMLLLHLLVVALIADDYSLGARQFEALRAALKLTPQDLVAHFKCAVHLSRGSLLNASEETRHSSEVSLPAVSCTHCLGRGLVAFLSARCAENG
jgi:hypothetical protein